MTVPAPVRDAATVVLLRDGDVGVQAYLLRRVRGMAFAGGMTVFPGGGVDARDTSADLGWSGPPPQEWRERLAADTGRARALVCAAVRELFEEAGVLLAGPSAAEVCSVAGPECAADRRALEDGTLSLGGLLARRGLLLRADLLRPWAHWITPAGEPRRYDTRFFVAALPAGQAAGTGAGTSEAEEAAWVRPADALAEYGRGERPMLPPTRVTLAEIAEHPTVAAVLAAAATRTVPPIEPRLRREPDGTAGVELPDGRTLPLGAPAMGGRGHD